MQLEVICYGCKLIINVKRIHEVSMVTGSVSLIT
jgi:hypothetical protein